MLLAKINHRGKGKKIQLKADNILMEYIVHFLSN